MADNNEQSSNISSTAPGELQLSFVFPGEEDAEGELATVSVDPLGDGISSLTLVNHMGNDEAIVNAARVSHGKRTAKLNDKDRQLLKFLAENRHTSPFRHGMLQFRVKAPEYVARQWYKHIVGADYGFKDTGWNEISQRYVEVEEFHYPQEWRFNSDTGDSGRCGTLYAEAISVAYDTYQRLLKRGVPREQARIVLPLSIYTEFIWTASLQAVVHFVELRRSAHAQQEIRAYADMMHILARGVFPESYTALTTYGV